MQKKKLFALVRIIYSRRRESRCSKQRTRRNNSIVEMVDRSNNSPITVPLCEHTMAHDRRCYNVVNAAIWE